MKKIYVIIDYKKRFNTKNVYAEPYMSGFDKSLIEKYFSEEGYETIFINYSDINFRDMNFSGKYVLYQSSEDRNLYYKSYIEDILLGLQMQGAILVPNYYMMRAHHNKVFMEILRDILNIESIKNIRSFCFGTFEDFIASKNISNDQVILKQDAGAMSTGVYLANNKVDAAKYAKKLSRTCHILDEIRDIARLIKHKGYRLDSRYRRKFIVQNYVPSLNDDWKVVVLGDKYYVLNRQVRKNDFRASGSGKFTFIETVPEGILEYAKNIFEYFGVPNISLDIAYTGNIFYLLEFQAVHFGTATIEKSSFYFELKNNQWDIVHDKSILEKEYVMSVVQFIGHN